VVGGQRPVEESPGTVDSGGSGWWKAVFCWLRWPAGQKRPVLNSRAYPFVILDVTTDDVSTYLVGAQGLMFSAVLSSYDAEKD